MAEGSTNPCTWERVLNDMAIIALDDAQAIQEILYMLDPSLTAAEVPDAVVTARPVLISANRWVLTAVSMTETEYDALDTDDMTTCNL